jgi:putative sigma-54 modulation protein
MKLNHGVESEVLLPEAGRETGRRGEEDEKDKERRLTMEVEFTARQENISKALRTELRTQAEEGLQRIARILGKATHASVIFSAQRHVQIAELSVQARLQKIVSTGKADSLEAALRQAIEHAENQSLRFRDRRLAGKRLPKEEKMPAAPPVTRPNSRVAQPRADGGNGKPARVASKTRTAIAVQSSAASATVVEPHVIESDEVFASQPMTIEEAVKDAEFRDRDLLIFRTAAGDMYVLHRRRDGEMELVEIP